MKATEGSGEKQDRVSLSCRTPLYVENVRRRVLHDAAKKAGAPLAGFHTFRHTCASLLFQRGANAVQVQRWLGHHSAAFTLATYVHLMDEDLGEPLSVDTELAKAKRALMSASPTELVTR